MFNFERDFSSDSTAGIVASQAAHISKEQRQRDVFESHRHRVFSLAFYMTANELEGEEILANTFIRVFEKSDSPEALEIDEALIFELSERFPLRQEEATAIPHPEGALGNRNVRRSDLEAALQSLPPGERLFFLLRDVEGYSLPMIARLLQISEAQAQRSSFSARIRLRQQLAKLTDSEMEAA